MTRLLFLPDDQTFLFIETAETPEEVVHAIARGIWQPPEPYGSLLQAGLPPEQQRALRALRLGKMVIIAPMQPLELAPEVLASMRPERLSPRQRQVLEAMAEGLNTKQIAERLGVGRRAVLLYINDLKARLGTSTRAQTVGRGVVMGLCKPRRGRR